MSTHRIFIVCLPVLFIAALLISGCQSLQYKTAPADVQAVAGQIAGYDLPEGYSEQFAVTALGYQMIGLQGATPSCHIYLVQAPKDTQANLEDLQKQAASMNTASKKNERRDVRVVEQRSAIVRGQTVTLLVGEGVNSENKPYREINALFDGKNGPALVNLSSPVDLWDWTLVDRFLASID